MGMRAVFILLSFCMLQLSVLAQTSPAGYAARWKAIDSLIEKKGLPESALAEVNKVYALAQREGNEPQLIKALVYRLTLEGSRTEDAMIKAIKALEAETAASKQPERAILQNILAGLYLHYLQQNSWTIRNRTNTNQASGDDIATWTVADLNKKISALYIASMEEEKLLAQINVEQYAAVYTRGNVTSLRPTLFDLLAHTALDYFMTGGYVADATVGSFESDDPIMFSAAPDFVRHTFRVADTMGLKYQAVLLFQRLIRLHLADKEPSALVDVDIDRLLFMEAQSTAPDKDEHYQQALRRITDRYDDLPAAARAWAFQALDLIRRADNPVVTEDSSGYWKAKAICEKVLKEKEVSEGQVMCSNTLHTIIQQELTLKTESVDIPNQPFRALLTWKNFPRLYLRVIRLDKPKEQNSYMIQQESFRKTVLSWPVFRATSMTLPDAGDLRVHRVEVPVGSLPFGSYALLASSDSSWSGKSGILGMLYFSVSSIAFINQDDDYFVLNRETGQPLAGASVQVWQPNNRSNGERLEKKGTYTADTHGHFLLRKAATEEYGQRLLEITIPGDHLFPMQAGYSYYRVEEPADTARGDKKTYESRHATTFLFTDRSIYRPGQMVCFKGIVITLDYDTRQVKPLSSFKTRVSLINANGEPVDTLSVTTNAFGSYTGVFKLPENQLNGNFQIRDLNETRSQSFSVEEYKRPKFFVTYEKQQGSYRVGDSVRVTGMVKGYAGNAIDGATVRYRITRNNHTLGWDYWRRPPSLRGQEIGHGLVVADASGRFSVVFYAAPDRSISRKTNPKFSFEVSADVTDINGETHSGSTTLVAGYSAVNVSIEGGIATEDLHEVTLDVTNLQKEPVSATVHLAIYPLRAPQRLIRERLWEAPDRYLLTEKQWLDSFPHDEYRKERDKESWERGGSLWDSTRTITGHEVIGLGRKMPAPGWYVIKASTTDKYGEEVIEESTVELYEAGTGRPGNPAYIWNTGGPGSVEPGGKAEVTAGSSAGDVYVIRCVQRNSLVYPDEAAVPEQGPLLKEWSFLRLNQERKSTIFPIKEEDRGGFGVADAFIKDNRLYTNLTDIVVPWTNKELTIQYSSFRDKTQPGSQEKWGMKISGKKGEKVSADILTTMYDASLDQFKMHEWDKPGVYPDFIGVNQWSTAQNFTVFTSQGVDLMHFNYVNYNKVYDQLLQPMGSGGYSGGGRRMYNLAMGEVAAPMMRKARAEDKEAPGSGGVADSTVIITGYSSVHAKVDHKEQSPQQPPSAVQARKDFRETAFFFPDLLTDSSGNVSFSFTMPEAMTTWKWLTLASTRDLAFGYSERSVITQKELMVQPNLPRFLREGDKMELQVKVVNLTDSELTGQMSLQLTDPTTGQTADGWFVNRQPNQYFTVGAHQSFVVGFPLDIPYQYNRPLSYRVVAEAGHHSDGEEGILPVVSNRMLVTESLPLNMKGDGTKQFTFQKLLQSGSSETLNHHSLTVEFTANPAWYAIQSLPYLMEFPHECAEQTFERVYANALASKITGHTPRLQEEFNRWKTTDTAQLLSNLQKNQELKSVLLEETPWVLEGKTEAEQKKRIALLFDMSRMSRELGSALDKLKAMQSSGGGFPWFKGGRDDRYITQYMLTGIGHLQKLQAIPSDVSSRIKEIVSAALPYVDARLRTDYKEILALEKKGVKRPWLGGLPIQYLYMRSLFPDNGIPGDVLPAVSYFRKRAQQEWLQYNKYEQGMIALALYRTGDVQTAKNIMASLKQNAIRDEERGMYWKGMEGGYYWYEAPVETQALLIEAFREITGDKEIDRQLKTWLLKQKQTQSWPTTKATADACYALLLGGQDWVNEERTVSVQLGDKTIRWPEAGASTGASAGVGAQGIGYYKKVFDGPFVDPAMGNITVTMKGNDKTGGSPAWGAVYWQYFDMLDHITSTGEARALTEGKKPALSVRKRLFIQRNTDGGPVLDSIADNGSLKPGDRVVVRIELRADREMEYVHLKDMRAACMEPVDVISEYKWQDGLGYYQSTKDASTDFFFDQVPRGTYVFEYTLLAGQSGNFSNGITSIECMYAPEFSFHSEGIRVNVEGSR